MTGMKGTGYPRVGTKVGPRFRKACSGGLIKAYRLEVDETEAIRKQERRPS